MHITAGGGIVSYPEFIRGGLVACLWASLYVLSGRSLVCRLSEFQDKITNTGYYFYLGLSLFLVLIQALSMLGIPFTYNLWLCIFALTSLSLFSKRDMSWSFFIRDAFRYVRWTYIIGFTALILLNIVAKERDLGDFYADIAKYIINTQSIPLLNRHYAQSILSAIILSTFDTPTTALAKMGGNLWLPVCEAFLLVIIYNLAESLTTKKINRFIICLIAFAGNCALSLLPQIPSDHDFPLIFNCYPDSVAGTAVAVMVIMLVVNYCIKPEVKFSIFLYVTGILFILFAALNQTAELNTLVIFAALVPVFMLTVWPQRKSKTLFRSFVVLSAIILALISSLFMGGIFMPKSHMRAINTTYLALFNDSGANASISNLKVTKSAQWYLPYITLGFNLDDGNYLSIFDKAIGPNEALNRVMMRLPSEGITKSELARAIFLLEQRFSIITKVLFWPIVASIGCLWLLFGIGRNRRDGFYTLVSKPGNVLFTKGGLCFSVMTFIIGLIDIPLNSYPGGAQYWKWALTRFNEIGLFLMMIYLGVFFTYFLDHLKSKPIRILSLAVFFVFSLSGVMLRLFAYPTFNG